jgi:hypothetical protein
VADTAPAAEVLEVHPLADAARARLAPWWSLGG